MKNMMKKLLFLLFCTVMICALSSVSVYAEEPAIITGDQTTTSLTAAFNGASGTDTLNVKLTGDVTVTDATAATQIILCKGTHELFLEQYELNAGNVVFVVGEGTTLNVYRKTAGDKTGSAGAKFNVINGGVLNYVDGSVTDIDTTGGTTAGTAAKIAYGGAVTSSSTMPSGSGYYYLENDINLGGSWSPSGNVWLDLNGRVLKGNGGSKVSEITITSGVTLTLTDSCDGLESAVHYYKFYKAKELLYGTKNGLYQYDFWALMTDEEVERLTSDQKNSAVLFSEINNLTDITDSTVAKTYGGVITGTDYIKEQNGNDVVCYFGAVFNSGTFIMNGGTICGNYTGGHVSVSDKMEQAIYSGGVLNKGTFIMNGGMISGNATMADASNGNGSAYGGGVCNFSGNFTMNGGVISGNVAKGIINVDTDGDGSVQAHGGGVYSQEGNFTMNGGVIRGNTVSVNIPYCNKTNLTSYACGGGVNINGYNSTITLTGGKITGNTAKAIVTGSNVNVFGGGVYYFDNDYYTSSTLTISGNVEITGNTVTAVSTGNTVTVHGGGISYGNYCNKGTVNLGGAAKISGNKKTDGTADNLYLPSGKTVTVQNGFSGNVGVTLADGTGTFTGANAADCSAYFTSDDPDYAVFNGTDNKPEIGKRTITVTADNTSLEYNGKAQSGTSSWTVNKGNKDVTVNAVLTSSTDVGDSESTVKSVTIKRGEVDVTSKYNISKISGTLTIKERQLTVTGTTADGKTYDGNTAAQAHLGSVSGIVGTDDVTVLIDTAAFNDKNAGNGKDVTITYAISGAAAGNYNKPADDTTIADISPRQLTVTGSTADEKVYDGNTTAQAHLGSVSGIVGTDDVTVLIDTAAFNDKNAGNGKDVTITYTISGADAGNYNKPINDTTSADITRCNVSVKADPVAINYGEALPGPTATVTGFIDGDPIAYTVKYSPDNPVNEGRYDINVTGEAVQGNYEVEYTNSLASKAGEGLTINPRVISLPGIYTGAFYADGKPVEANGSGEDTYLNISGKDAKVLTYYEYTTGNGEGTEAQRTYPVSMKVWILSYDNGYVLSEFTELENALTYCGTSIRTSGNKGIRVITGINETLKNQLISGLKGWTLTEYGTVIAWTSQLGTGGLTLEASGAQHNYAYSKAAGTDPVFNKVNGMVQYTNVLILKDLPESAMGMDITMRPYMKLSDSQGNEIVVYGGEIVRSIGYVAYQNRNEFTPGTSEYKYIWAMIHAAYGDTYDSEYKL